MGRAIMEAVDAISAFKRHLKVETGYGMGSLFASLFWPGDTLTLPPSQILLAIRYNTS